ncbi:hypothetical protein V494_00438, partial [Pseudogymnoascus sp. VKM F-4513 (FW-928)]
QLMSTPVPKGAWKSIALDFIVKLPLSKDPLTGVEYNSILVITERLTKYGKFVPYLEASDAKALAQLRPDESQAKQALIVVEQLKSFHEQLATDIQFLNDRSAAYANRKRSIEPAFKEGDKIIEYKVEAILDKRQLVGDKEQPQLPRVASGVPLSTPHRLKNLGDRVEKRSCLEAAPLELVLDGLPQLRKLHEFQGEDDPPPSAATASCPQRDQRRHSFESLYEHIHYSVWKLRRRGSGGPVSRSENKKAFRPLRELFG